MLLSVMFGLSWFPPWYGGKWNIAKFSVMRVILCCYMNFCCIKKKRGRRKLVFCAVTEFCQLVPKMECDCFHMWTILYLDELMSHRTQPFCRKRSYLKKLNICVFNPSAINERLTCCLDLQRKSNLNAENCTSTLFYHIKKKFWVFL